MNWGVRDAGYLPLVTLCASFVVLNWVTVCVFSIIRSIRGKGVGEWVGIWGICFSYVGLCCAWCLSF